MARFDHNTYRSLNESISHVQNPQAALDEALEYAEFLEDVLNDICEELGLDPQALVEDIQTAERARELNNKIRRVRRAARDGGPSLAHQWNLEDQRVRERHQTPTKLYGKGGKIVATRTRKSKVKYGAWKPTKRK